jgi:hypothetical protein
VFFSPPVSHFFILHSSFHPRHPFLNSQFSLLNSTPHFFLTGLAFGFGLPPNSPRDLTGSAGL